MLYICSTPIGNLGDITLRALEILKSCDCIACETVSHTGAMLNHYGINKRLISYREDNRDVQSEVIFELLEQEQNVVLVSDAGTPGVSDPGFRLVDEALNKGFPVSVLPGASSAICALVLSGFPSDSFVFLGFLPRKTLKREAVYEEIMTSLRTVIFFEAPHRIVKTLEELAPFIKDRKIALCREITKKFEEVIRGSIDEVISLLESRKIQGEFTVVIEPATDRKESDFVIDDELIESKLKMKISPRQIVDELSPLAKNKKELYARVIKIKDSLI